MQVDFSKFSDWADIWSDRLLRCRQTIDFLFFFVMSIISVFTPELGLEFSKSGKNYPKTVNINLHMLLMGINNFFIVRVKKRINIQLY